ncbi:MAG: purine-nucleoside phosphorylase [Rhodothermales bacterium]
MLEQAVARIREETDLRPRVALVLGSGMGDLADSAENPIAVSTSEVPGYPRSTVEGHRGRLVFGSLEGVPLVFVQGRAHLYEGHDVHAVAFPIRLLHALGARRLLVTNAAGGINPLFRPGTLMFISDHISFVAASPLAASPSTFDPEHRFVRALYDAEWTDAAEAIALRLGIRTARGVYLWARGPSYESAAEVAAFGRLGADAVGMSTVPEVVAAAALGMRVLGISTITNPAAGLSKAPLAHEDVLAVGRQVRTGLEALIRAILWDLG